MEQIESGAISERAGFLRRNATGVYIIYALDALFHAVLVLSYFSIPLVVAEAAGSGYDDVPCLLVISLLVVTVPFLPALTILAMALAMKDRFLIAFIAIIQLILSLMITVVMGCSLLEQMTLAGKPNGDLLIMMVMALNLHVIIPAAVIVFYSLENKSPAKV